METKQIASRLAELCQQNEFEKAQIEFYGDDVVSTEQQPSPAFEKETKGKEAVLAKIKKFDGMVEQSFGNKVSEPLVTGNSFAFVLSMDIKMRGQDRMTMEELCVYTVKDGKVVLEQFFM